MNTRTATGLGLLADLCLGEPPLRPHPVSAFGTVMRSVERRLHRDSRTAGVAHAVLGTTVGAAAGRALRSTAATTYLVVAGHGLVAAAHDVARRLEQGDLEGARGLLPALVGRDPWGLDEKEVVRAVVESVAENTVDAVVAPALWAVVAGAAGAGAHRAVNTMDAMVGHHTERYERYGWASARLDDVVAWAPARATAALVAAVRPRRAGAVLTIVRRDATAHPSPNAGVAEAAFAAALDLRLGGTNRYGDALDVRPSLGSGRLPEVDDIRRATRLCRDVSLALSASLLAAGSASR